MLLLSTGGLPQNRLSAAADTNPRTICAINNNTLPAVSLYGARNPMKPSCLLFIILLLCTAAYARTAAAGPATNWLAPAGQNLPGIIRDAARQGRRLIIFFYSINEPRAREAAVLMQDFYLQRRQYNFELQAVALDKDRPDAVRSFNAEHMLTFPVLLDADGTIAPQFNMRDAAGFILLNEQGRQTGYRRASHTPAHMNLTQQWKTYLCAQLDIPYIPGDQPVLGLKPAAPKFDAETIDGRKVSVADLWRDKPLVIAIFSPRCANCVNELDFLNSLYTGELKGGFDILALSLMADGPTAAFMRDNNYAFTAVADPQWRLIALFESFTGPVPCTFLINTQGLIEYVHIGFNTSLKDIYRMRLRRLAGMDNPPLLVRDGYSGEQSCGICHERQHLQWSLTGHAAAFSSLRRKGETGNPACIGCHVTGYGKPGGYQLQKHSAHLENIQCETCHGPGYQSCSAYSGKKPHKKTAAQWKTLCLECHTAKESLNFVFPRRFLQVRHSAMPELDGLDRAGRLALLNRSPAEANPFDNPAPYVGAQVCRDCHPDQYRHWSSTAHARVVPDSTTPPGRLRRVVTGLGAAGGYPEPDRKGVQCEACHGPAGRHIDRPEAKGHGYIVGLDSECPSCVVEQICRTCHGIQDDPEFDFDREIEKVRHPKSPP